MCVYCQPPQTLLTVALDSNSPIPTMLCPVCHVELTPGDIKLDARFLRLMDKYPDAEGCVIERDGTDKAIEKTAETVDLLCEVEETISEPDSVIILSD